MTPFEFAWSVLKADFARPLPGMTNFASQNEPNKGQFANLYENEEVKDVNEALRQLGVAPEGLTAEMANYAPGFAQHSAYDTTAMPRDFGKPHQYLPYRTSEEKNLDIPSFPIHDREANTSTMDRMNTIEELIEARRRRESRMIEIDFEYVMAFLKAKRDTPNYREASEEEMKIKKNCGTCKAWGILKQVTVSGTTSHVKPTIFAMRG